MKTTVYLIRHAEADGNWKRTFQGHSNSNVSEKGYRQLEYLARRFESIPLDVIYSSPLIRAYETARAAGRASGLPIVTDDELKEINGGEFEGVPFAELPIRFPVQEALWDNEPWNFQAPGGESMREVFTRMQAAVDRIVRENAGKSIAIATHGCSIRNYLCWVFGWEITEIANVKWCDNTAVSIIEYDDSFRPNAVLVNDISHLPDDLSTLAFQSWWKSVPAHREPDTATV